MARRWGLVVIAALLCAAAPAHAASLYDGPGPRPGPDLLYGPAVTAPQLTNAAPWKADPILVSGATAYRGGEFLYQDFLYDDHGAGTGVFDPGDPRASANAFSKPNGTYTYPTDPKYANNAADIVELRVRPLAGATAFRLTLNTMKDQSLIGASIAIGGNPSVALPFPHGANVKAPADLFLTVHPGSGGGADLVTAATGQPAPGGTPTVTVDKERRQIEVRVPHSAWDPGDGVVRLAAATGLWDAAANAYLTPLPAATAAQPGGSGGAAAPAAFFNVAFRNNEPVPTIGDVFNSAKSPAWWRDKQQGAALASGDISAFHADVDFGKLASNANDDAGVPQTGPLDRILASRFETAQGADYSVSCTTNGDSCTGPYQGRLQPYAIYVPKQARPARGYGMTLLMHSLSTNYNQYLGSRNQAEFGERGSGSVVITPEARGPDGGYGGYAAADVFEVWADVARHYQLDPEWTVATGYSMGAIGTFKLSEQFPDLFARAQPTVGESTDNLDMIDSLRNIPVLMWNGAADELVGPELYLPTAQRLDQLGYRYELDVFAPGEHNSLAINDEFDQAAAFLGTATVDRDPPHVTFVAKPALDLPKLDYVSDHAYWLSGVKLRDPGGGTGRIDVLSHGFGAAEPSPGATQAGAGTVTGGYFLPEYPFTRTFKEWSPGPPASKQDVLDVSASNVRTVRVDAPRARVSCAAKLMIESDGPLDVVLGGCGQAASLPRASRCVDRRKFTFRLHHAPGARVVRVVAYVNGKRVLRRSGPSIKRVTLKRLPRRKFTVRIVSTQNTGSKLISVRRYNGCKKGKPRTRAHHHP